MKIPEFGSLLMSRTDSRHFGSGKIVQITQNVPGNSPVPRVDKVTRNTEAVSLSKADGVRPFQDFLMEAVNSVNSQQLTVASLEKTIITDPDSVDIHDATIAMQKARMSLNLAQTVISRLVEDWNEITTTR